MNLRENKKFLKNYSDVKSSILTLKSFSELIIPFPFKYSRAKTQKIKPKLFFPLLLQGITYSRSLVSLLVSHNAITGTPTRCASVKIFLSGKGSTTRTN